MLHPPEEVQDFKAASSTTLWLSLTQPLNFTSNPPAVGIFHHSNATNPQNISLKMCTAGNSWLCFLAQECTVQISEHNGFLSIGVISQSQGILPNSSSDVETTTTNPWCLKLLCFIYNNFSCVIWKQTHDWYHESNYYKAAPPEPALLPAPLWPWWDHRVLLNPLGLKVAIISHLYTLPCLTCLVCVSACLTLQYLCCVNTMDLKSHTNRTE